MTQSRRVDGAGVFPAVLGETLVVVGNFDGVHGGHQAVLVAAAAEAQRAGLTPVVLTFHPHPAQVLGRRTVGVLTALERKVELLTRVSPALWVVVQPFSLELAAVSAEQFVRDLLVGQLRAKTVIVGENFRFGQGRQGDFAQLQGLGQVLGFETHAARLVGDAQGAYSSTRVRDALARGDLEEVERLLSRPHALTGRVVAGDGRGRTIGVPTANLSDIVEALPPLGVYACLVDHWDPQTERFTSLAEGVLNIGVRPTVAAGFSVEVHLLDFNGDLYGHTLRLHLGARIRDEQRFGSIGELVAQITRDIAAGRAALAGRSPRPEAGGAFF